MTVLEAMACGLPVITTVFGGQMDYLKDMDWKQRFIIDGKFVPARYSPWDIGKWKKPNIQQLREGLRIMYKERPPKKKYKGIERWTWKEAALKAKKCLEEL